MSLRPKPARFLAFLALWAVLLPSVAEALPPSDCRTPRNATDSVFAWLQPATMQPEEAARCLEPTGRTPAELARSAQRIKDVFDERAILVDMAALSDDPNWSHPVTHQSRFAPDPRLPAVVVERQNDGMWRWTAASLDRVDQLYASSMANRLVDRLPSSLRVKFLSVELWQYAALLLLILLGLALRKLISVVVRNRVRKVAEHLGHVWVSKLVAVVASPGATLAMAGVLGLLYPQLGLPIRAALAMASAVRLLLVVSVVWGAYRFVDLFAEGMARKASETQTKLDDQLVPLLRRSVKVVVVIAGGIFILQNLSVDVGSLLAGLGIGGLAFALAAKDTIANFFGSIMIFADRPFQIGDWIVVTGAEGVVEEVGFRSTRVRSFDNSLITIPNASFTESKIHNYGARIYRRCSITLNLTYATTPEQMQAFVEGVRAILLANPHTRKDAYEVHMAGFGASSVDVMVYFFFKVPTWSDELRARHNIFLEIMRLAKELSVDFAFPTRTLHIESAAEAAAHVRAPTPSNDDMASIIHAFGPGGKSARPAGPTITAGFLPSPSETKSEASA